MKAMTAPDLQGLDEAAAGPARSADDGLIGAARAATVLITGGAWPTESGQTATTRLGSSVSPCARRLTSC